MLATALTAGLAAFTLWHAIARKQPPGIRQAYAALPDPIRRFVGCAWCAGFWLAVLAVLALTWRDLDPGTTIVTVLAAGAVPGVLDSFTPDDGSVL